ncbi:MAG: hypothetical protein EOO91_01995 [Pedobacter sp.]|nr:MAG: hypothetical protein EOO91_01995 [Pedobacter sp.]
MRNQKRQQQTPQAKTQFVMIDAALQSNNAEVLKAFTGITAVASELLKKFEMTKYRTYVMVDHNKNETNANLVSEFICHFWNITLSNSKEGKSYIFISLDEESLTKFGNGLTNMLVREAYKITQSNDNTTGIEYALRVDFLAGDVHNLYYRRVIEGETEYTSIITAPLEKAETN